jgi:KRAB domain-containing zinc finger protein
MVKKNEQELFRNKYIIISDKMSVIKQLKWSLARIESAVSNWNRQLLHDVACLREESVHTTDTALHCGPAGSGPLRAHSLLLAAACPALAALLAPCQGEEGFVLLLPEADRREVEEVVGQLYKGNLRPKQLGLLRSWGLWAGPDPPMGDSEPGDDAWDPDPDPDSDVESKYHCDDNNFDDIIDVKDEAKELMHYDQEDKPKANNKVIKTKQNKTNATKVRKRQKTGMKGYSDWKTEKTCDQCAKVFANLKSLDNHIKRKHSDNVYICDQCDYTCTFKGDLKYHTESKHTLSTFDCKDCGKSFRHKVLLSMHVKEMHTAGKLFMCDKCDFTCQAHYDNKLKWHMEKKHGEIRLVCPFCDYFTSSSAELQQHKENNHKMENFQNSPLKLTEIKRKEREALKDFTCHICHENKKSRQTLKAHIMAKHEGNQFRCPEEGCDHARPSKRLLQNHIDSVHLGIKYPCNLCTHVSNLKTNLQAHMTKKHGKVPFTCAQCAYRCQDKDRMQNHMLMHQ